MLFFGEELIKLPAYAELGVVLLQQTEKSFGMGGFPSLISIPKNGKFHVLFC